MPEYLEKKHISSENLATKPRKNRGTSKFLHLLFGYNPDVSGEKHLFGNRRTVSIRVDPAKCTACGKCADVCRHHVLSKEKFPAGPIVVANPSACTGCLHCMGNCEQQAIEVTRYQ